MAYFISKWIYNRAYNNSKIFEFSLLKDDYVKFLEEAEKNAKITILVFKAFIVGTLLSSILYLLTSMFIDLLFANIMIFVCFLLHMLNVKERQQIVNDLIKELNYN